MKADDVEILLVTRSSPVCVSFALGVWETGLLLVQKDPHLSCLRRPITAHYLICGRFDMTTEEPPLGSLDL